MNRLITAFGSLCIGCFGSGNIEVGHASGSGRLGVLDGCFRNGGMLRFGNML